MDLRQIKYFVALFEEGSVTRAAKRLNVVQPAVSMQIARLEEELGQCLFDRRSKSMVPTTAGRTLHRLVQPVLQHLAVAHEHMAKLSGVVSGRVTVGMLASLAANFVPRMLPDFAKEYPEVEVAIIDGYSSTFIDLVNDQAIDFAIINRPARRLGLVVEPLVEEEMMFVTSVDRGKSEPATNADLREAKLILPSRRHGLRAELDRHFTARELPLELQLEMDSIEGICQVVARSEWSTLLPSLAAKAWIADGRLSARSITPPMTRQLAIIHHPNHPLSLAAEAFIRRLRERVEAAAVAQYQAA